MATAFTRSASSEVTAVDFAWTPSHVRHNDTVTTEDSGRAERITFLRTQAEVVTAVDTIDRLALRVGHTPPPGVKSPGWEVREFSKTIHRDLTPGESLTFIVEDYFEYRTLQGGVIWLQNTEGRLVSGLVTENVLFDGRIDVYRLFDGALPGKSFEPVRLHQPVTLPSRVVFHRVTMTNNEPDLDAYVIVRIAGWVGHSTHLPVELPTVYGEGLQ